MVTYHDEPPNHYGLPDYRNLLYLYIYIYIYTYIYTHTHTHTYAHTHSEREREREKTEGKCKKSTQYMKELFPNNRKLQRNVSPKNSHTPYLGRKWMKSRQTTQL